MQKKCNIVLWILEYACMYGQKKHAHDQQKNIINKKWQNMQKNATSSVCNAVFWRLPSRLINISLSGEIPWENPQRAF